MQLLIKNKNRGWKYSGGIRIKPKKKHDEQIYTKTGMNNRKTVYLNIISTIWWYSENHELFCRKNKYQFRTQPYKTSKTSNFDNLQIGTQEFLYSITDLFGATKALSIRCLNHVISQLAAFSWWLCKNARKWRWID